MDIRYAQIKDIPRILKLIKELARFEKEPEAVDLDEKYLIEYGFGKNKMFECFVAEDTKAEVIGMALFYHRFSTWKGLTLHLEDLIVQSEYRNQGVGKALFEKFIQFAKDKKINRIEWVVLEWNTKAIDFYKSYGAKVFKDWRTVQMDYTTIQNFIR